MTLEIADFQRDVLERSRRLPVVTDFWAAWCGPCRILGPVLEKLAEEADGRWVLAKVDTERFPEVAARYGVMSIPNVKLFVNGEVADEFVGALPEPEVRRWLDRVLPSPRSAEVAEAKSLLEERRFEEAQRKLRRVLEDDPGNREARVALAQAKLHTSPREVEETLRGMDFDPALHDRVEALHTLAKLVSRLERVEELPHSPGRGRFVEALRAIREARWEAAFEDLIGVLAKDRDYAGGAAREAGRALFRLLGIRHPVCEKFHRAFASALHV